MRSLSSLKVFVFSLRASDVLGADQFNALHTLIDETSKELHMDRRPIDDLTSFADLDLFPRMHGWIEAKMTEMMEPDVSICVDETVVELLVCMKESATLFFYCLGGADRLVIDHIKAVADKIIKEEKMRKALLWAILVDSSKGLAGLLAVISKLTLRVRDGFLAHVKDLSVHMHEEIGRLCHFICVAGHLDVESSLNTLLPLMPTSVQQGLAQSCQSLAAHFRLGENDVWTRSFWNHNKEAIIWYGDLVSFLLLKHPFEEETRQEHQRLFQVLMDTLEALVRVSAKLTKTVHVYFYKNWLEILIDNYLPLEDEGGKIINKMACVTDLILTCVDFSNRQLDQEQPGHLFELWAATARFLSNNGKSHLHAISGEHLVVILSRIEMHLRYLGRSHEDPSIKTKAFSNLCKLADCVGVILISRHKSEEKDFPVRFCSLLATMRKASIQLLNSLSTEASFPSFSSAVLINKALSNSLLGHNISRKMNEWKDLGMDHAPLIHLLPALIHSSTRLWILGEQEFIRINSILPNSDDEVKKYNSMKEKTTEHMAESVSRFFDTLTSTCNRILQFAHSTLSKASPPGLWTDDEAQGKEAVGSSGVSNGMDVRGGRSMSGRHMAAEEAEADEASEEAEVKEAPPYPILFFPTAIIYSSGIATMMLQEAYAPLASSLLEPCFKEAIKIKLLIEPVSMALGTLLDLASTLTLQSRFMLSNSKEHDDLALHISLAADLIEAVFSSRLIETISSLPLVKAGEGREVFIHLLARTMKCLSSCCKDIGSVLDRLALGSDDSSMLAHLLAASGSASRSMAVSILGFKQATAKNKSSVGDGDRLSMDSLQSAYLLSDNFRALLNLLLRSQHLKPKPDEFYEDWGITLHSFGADDKPLRFCSNVHCLNLEGGAEHELRSLLCVFYAKESYSLCQQCFTVHCAKNESVVVAPDVAGFESESDAAEDLFHPANDDLGHSAYGYEGFSEDSFYSDFTSDDESSLMTLQLRVEQTLPTHIPRSF
jgi:hypothetical protein